MTRSVARSPQQIAIIHLERTLTDFDFQPKTWTGALVARQGKAGEGPTTTRRCSRAGCQDGVVRVRGIERLCDGCGGRGVEVVDAYTERKVRTAEQEGESQKRMVRCDACGGTGKGKWWRNGDELDNTCTRCWGAKVVPGPSSAIRPFRLPKEKASANGERSSYGDPILACMERRQEEGSYDELWLALSALRLEHRLLYRVNVAVYVEALREEDELDRFHSLLLDESLAYLESLMPAQIRVPSWAKRYEERRREKIESEREVAA